MSAHHLANNIATLMLTHATIAGDAAEKMACTTLVKRDLVYFAKLNAKVMCTTNATHANIAGDAAYDGMHDRREA